MPAKERKKSQEQNFTEERHPDPRRLESSPHQSPYRAVLTGKTRQVFEQRWQIEIRFRAIKQSTQMKKSLGRITNQFHLQPVTATILATFSMNSEREKPSRS